MKPLTSKKRKLKIIKVDPYGMWIAIDFNPESYTSKFIPLDQLKNYDAVCIYPEGLGFTSHNTPDVIMAFSKYSTSALAHECVHAANFILDSCGVKITPDNDEALAYLVGWLAREVNNFAHDITEKKKC